MSANRSVEELFAAVVERLVAADPELELDRMFASTGLKTPAGFAALLRDGDLVVKLPRERVAELLANGTGRPFGSGGRVMKQWVRLRPPDERACEAYIAEARRFVQEKAEVRPRRSRPGRARGEP